jgi:hypothetical protein
MKHKLSLTLGIVCIIWAGVTIAVAANAAAAMTQPFVLTAKLMASDKAASAEFGAAVVLSPDGQIMVVGAPLHDVDNHDNQGQVYVFRRSDTGWTEVQQLVAADGEANDEFGTSIAIADAPDYTIIVGAPFDDTGAHSNLGAAYIFAYDGSSWSQQTKLGVTDANEFSQDQRGRAVAISADGNTAFAGAPGVGGAGGSEPGAVYIFTRSGNTWTQTQKVEGPTSGAAGLGRSMRLSDNDELLLVAGLYSPAGPIIGNGIVRIYQKPGGTWGEIASLIPSDSGEFDEFGASIAISDDTTTILVGAPNKGSGQAYVFTKNGGTWTEQLVLTRPDGSPYGRFGQSLALDTTGTQATIGAWLNGSGAIHLLEGSGSVWDFRQTLTTLDNRQEHLGFAIDMTGDGNLIAGGARSAHSSTDVFDAVGAVYLFVPGFNVYLPIVAK